MGSSREAALGDQSGLLQSILDNTNPSHSPVYNIWSYLSQYGMGQGGMNKLLAMLQGNQMRDLGIAGRQAGASAAAYGYNPTSAIQRAQSPIYSDYAKQAMNLPLLQQQLQLGNFDVLHKLLQDKMGIAGQRADEGGGIGGLVGGLGSAAITKFSDRRLKENIVQIGTYDNGIPKYSFNYLWSDEPQIGAMADEVESILPSAIGNYMGYKTVDYSMLG